MVVALPEVTGDALARQLVGGNVAVGDRSTAAPDATRQRARNCRSYFSTLCVRKATASLDLEE